MSVIDKNRDTRRTGAVFNHSRRYSNLWRVVCATQNDIIIFRFTRLLVQTIQCNLRFSDSQTQTIVEQYTLRKTDSRKKKQTQLQIWWKKNGSERIRIEFAIETDEAGFSVRSPNRQHFTTKTFTNEIIIIFCYGRNELRWLCSLCAIVFHDSPSLSTSLSLLLPLIKNRLNFVSDIHHTTDASVCVCLDESLS